jgi:hypothetical protein
LSSADNKVKAADVPKVMLKTYTVDVSTKAEHDDSTLDFLTKDTSNIIVAADYSITTTTANLVPGTTTTMSFRTNNA